MLGLSKRGWGGVEEHATMKPPRNDEKIRKREMVEGLLNFIEFNSTTYKKNEPLGLPWIQYKRFCLDYKVCYQ